MTGCFAFRFFESHSSRRANLVLFFSAEVSADVISKVVKKDIEKTCRLMQYSLLLPKYKKGS